MRLVCGDFLTPPLTGAGVVFTHNIVFSRALQRAMQLKMDRELPPGACRKQVSSKPRADVVVFASAGAVVFAVLELQYTKRGVLSAELAASYNWAPDGELRPLYEYVFEGEPLAPDSGEDSP